MSVLFYTYRTDKNNIYYFYYQEILNSANLKKNNKTNDFLNYFFKRR